MKRRASIQTAGIIEKAAANTFKKERAKRARVQLSKVGVPALRPGQVRMNSVVNCSAKAEVEAQFRRQLFSGVRGGIQRQWRPISASCSGTQQSVKRRPAELLQPSIQQSFRRKRLAELVATFSCSAG